MRHEPEALLRVDEEDEVRRMRTQLLGRGARHERACVHGAATRCLLRFRRVRAAGRAEVSREIPDGFAAATLLVGDAVGAFRPVEYVLRHRTPSSTRLTWEESTPPSP